MFPLQTWSQTKKMYYTCGQYLVNKFPIDTKGKFSVQMTPLKTPCKILELTITPSGRKVMAAKESEKNAANSGHLVPWQRTQAAQAKMVTAFHSLVFP